MVTEKCRQRVCINLHAHFFCASLSTLTAEMLDGCCVCGELRGRFFHMAICRITPRVSSMKRFSGLLAEEPKQFTARAGRTREGVFQASSGKNKYFLFLFSFTFPTESFPEALLLGLEGGFLTLSHTNRSVGLSMHLSSVWIPLCKNACHFLPGCPQRGAVLCPSSLLSHCPEPPENTL